MAAFEKKHRGRPFRLVGIHCQKDTPEAIVALCKLSGVEFSIVDNGNYKKPVSGIPHAFVFDHTGKEIFEGHPSEAEAVVEKALLLAPGLYLGEAKFEKLKSVAAQIEKKAALGASTASLRKKYAESADAVEKSEAESLLKIVEDYAQRRREHAASCKDQDPELYVSQMKGLAKEFSGDSLGADLKAALDKDLADPEFKKLCEGMKAVVAQEKALESLLPCKTHKQKGEKAPSADCEACKKQNEALVAKVKKALEGIAEKHQGTPVETRAREILESL